MHQLPNVPLNPVGEHHKWLCTSRGVICGKPVDETQAGILGDCSITFRGLANKNVESIKSLEAVKPCGVEEAHMLTKRSLQLLRPTISAEGSEIMATADARSLWLTQFSGGSIHVIERLSA
jgi:hypothetical protein